MDRQHVAHPSLPKSSSFRAECARGVLPTEHCSADQRRSLSNNRQSLHLPTPSPHPPFTLASTQQLRTHGDVQRCTCWGRHISTGRRCSYPCKCPWIHVEHFTPKQIHSFPCTAQHRSTIYIPSHRCTHL